MRFATTIRQRAGAANLFLQHFVLRSEWLPTWLVRAFGGLQGTLTARAYALPSGSIRADPRHQLARLLRRGDVVLDVGASRGHMAEIASRCVGPGGRVYAFEPQRDDYEVLEAKRVRFGWRNVVAIRTLVGEASGEQILYQHPSNSEISSLSPGWNQVESRPVRHPTLALDDWAQQRSPERVDLVKIDVEGAELGVIRGARGLLATHRPPLLIEINNRARRRSLFGYTVDDLLSELRRAGYDRFATLRPTGLRTFEREADLETEDRDMLAR